MLQDNAVLASNDDAPQSSRTLAPFTLTAGPFAAGRLRVLSFRGREAVSWLFRFGLVVCVVVAGLSLRAPAFAAPPPGPRSAPPASPKNKDRADDLFDQGTAAVDAGHLAEAEAKFAEAWSLKQTHDIAGNLGIMERHLGKNVVAAQHLAWALAHLPPTEATATRKGLEDEFQKARAEVGAVRVRVDVDGAAITVNGQDAGVAPLAAEVFVEAGEVTVAGSREDYVTIQQTVTVAKGADAREVTLTLVPVGDVQTRRSVVPGAVLGGVGGAALVAGIGLFAAARGERSSAQSTSQAIQEAHHSCVAKAPNFDAQCVGLQSTASTGVTLEHASAGMFIGGGAAVAGAVVYFVWQRASPAAPKSGTWRITPAVSPAALGLAASGTF